MELFRIIVPSSNIEVSTRFYQIIFDQRGERVSDGRHYFTLGKVIIAVYDPFADGDVSEIDYAFHENQYLYFSVDNLETTYQKCNIAGANLMDTTIETMPWGETLFYTVDPSGVPICFVQKGTEFISNL